MAKITLVAFRTKYLGKRINGWSSSGGQCVDLVRQYLVEVRGWTRTQVYQAIPPGNANTWYRNASTTWFKKYANTTANRPPYDGCIGVITSGEYGHVFVVKKGSDGYKMLSLDQNWSVYRRVSDEAHRYTGVAGWLLPIK